MHHLYIASRTIEINSRHAVSQNFPGTKKLRGINGMKQMYKKFELESDPTCITYETIVIQIVHFCFEFCTCFSNMARTKSVNMCFVLINQRFSIIKK